MISHKHRCLFTHVPKAAGRSVLAAFGLPLTAKDYDNSLTHIEWPFGHQPLKSFIQQPAFAYFKFAFVRDPWDRLVSAFHYLHQGGCNEFDAAFRDAHLLGYEGNFTAFARDLERHLDTQHFRPQSYWLCDASGKLLADFVGRYEHISRDFSLVAQRLSLDANLARLNTSRHTHYREYYTPETRDIVRRLYRQDIEMFGYEYGY